MNHTQHVRLIRKAIPRKGGVWADLGSGDGAFTLALADLGGEDITIYSVDRDRARLKAQSQAFSQRFPDSDIHFQPADFTGRLNLPPLDGILMANSLHFVRDKRPLIIRLGGYLKKEGRFVLVEYNTDQGNYWVPYPLSYNSFFYMAPDCGLTGPQMLDIEPSSFLKEMYSALCFKLD